jgi:hypothetical protein
MSTITAVLVIFTAIILILGWRAVNKKETEAPTRMRRGGPRDDAR